MAAAGLLRVVCLLFAFFGGVAAAYGAVRLDAAIGAGATTDAWHAAALAVAGAALAAACLVKAAHLHRELRASLADWNAFQGTILECHQRLVVPLAFFGLAVAGIVVVAASQHEIVAVGFVLAFGGAALVAGRFGLQLKPEALGGMATLRLDHYRLRHAWCEVEWADVAHVSLREAPLWGVPMRWLSLRMRDPKTRVPRLPAFEVRRRSRVPDAVEIPLSLLDRTPEDIAATAQALHAGSLPGPVPGWRPGMTAADVDLARELSALASPDVAWDAMRRRLAELEPRLRELDERAAADRRRGRRRIWIALGCVGMVAVFGALAPFLR